MARICMTVIGEVKLREDEQNFYVNEKSSAGELLMNEITHKNNTFYLTTETEECLERLKNNQSDYSTSMVSYFENLDGFTVPVPMFPSKVQFITGYRLNDYDVKPRECATVIANIKLLGPFVHLASLALIFSAILIMLVGIVMQFQYKEKHSRRFSLRKRSKVALFRSVMRELIKELSLVYYGYTKHFKWLSFLFAILSFYLLLSINSLYKTSHVIVIEPYVVKDYKMLLQDKKSLPIFYDSLSITSELFKFAPENSLRQKIWSKAFESKHLMNNDIVTGNATHDVAFLHDLFHKINEKHSAFFAHTLLSQFITYSYKVI